MLNRRTSGTVNCYSCGKLVSVDSKTCVHCEVENPGLWGYAHLVHRFKYNYSFTDVITWGCVSIYVLTLLVDVKHIGFQIPFNILSPSGWSLILFGATGAYPLVALQRWWTVFTVGWLHGNMFHIAFNLAIIRSIAPYVIDFYGATRMIIIYVVSQVTAALLSSGIVIVLPQLPPVLQGALVSVGASGALFGLLGALVSYGQRTGRGALTNQLMIYAGAGFVSGFLLPQVDNWGHLGGFLGGFLITKTPWFNPKQPQTVRDIILALIFLVVTVLSLGLSVVDGFVRLDGLPELRLS